MGNLERYFQETAERSLGVCGQPGEEETELEAVESSRDFVLERLLDGCRAYMARDPQGPGKGF